jgi:hypothetical protein
MRTIAIALVSLGVGISQGAVDRWLGSWDRGSNATLEIVRDKTDSSTVRLTFIVTTPRGCTGEAAGQVALSELSKSAVTLKAGLPESTERDCEMRLELSADNDLVVDEGSCSSLHGAACEFSGRYRK